MEDEEDDPETLKAKKEMKKTFPNKLNPSPEAAPGTPTKVLNLDQSDAVTESLKTDTEFNSLKEDITTP